MYNRGHKWRGIFQPPFVSNLQMDSLRHQTDLERKERAKAVFRVTENIAQEREGIVTQVNLMLFHLLDCIMQVDLMSYLLLDCII